MRRLIAICFMYLIAGCSSAPETYSLSAAPSSPAAQEEAPAAGAVVSQLRSAAPAASRSLARSEPSAAAVARKVHHEGSIRLRATQPQRVLEQATQWALASGGYVESLSSQNVVLQIPAERFRSLYDQVLGLGEVLAKSLAARDVTDEFLDVEMRLAQGKATRDRLLALIARSTNQNEKLRLLREVERLSKDIELLEARMARLQTLVEYSRLALAVEGRKAFEGQPLQEVRGFEWVGTLASDIRREDRDATRFSLATPVGMVELDGTRLWSASSPDGVTLTTQQRRNEPKGTTALWLDALRWRLQGRFGEVDQKTAGEFTLLRLVSTEEPRFIFWVAISAKDDRLFVAQAYFPSGDREQRYEAQIMNSLRGGVK